MTAKGLALLVSATAIAGCAVVAPSAPPAGGIDPRRVGSCVLAAENMGQRVRPDTEDFARYAASKEYYSGHLALMVPDESARSRLLNEGRVVLAQSLARQDSFAGMIMLGDVLSQCDSDRSRLEQYTSGLRNG